MKKSFLVLATMLSCALVTLPSCGDDDPIEEIKPEKPDPKPEPEKPADAKEMTVDATAYDKWVYVNLSEGTSEVQVIDPVSGGYKGNVNVNVAGKDYGNVEDLNLSIARIEGDSVQIELKDFAFGNMKIDVVKCAAKVEVDSIGEHVGYVLTGSEAITEVNGMTIKATPKGHIIGKDINIKIKVIPGAMPMPISATYTGKLETGVNQPTIDWDLAFHRWDVKTNGGSAVESAETELENLKEIPAEGYKEDTESDKITVDMRKMQAGKIGYATDFVNEVLSSWMNVNMQNMPPAYTMSDKVYVFKTSAGKSIKIKFTDFTDDKGNKGHVAFKYAEIK